jgi:hypothetical protein
VVDARRSGLGAVRLNGDGEATPVQGFDGGFVELEQRLTARAHYEWHSTLGPAGGNARPAR